MLHAIDTHFKMQVWSGRPARGTDEANGLALCDTLAALHHDFAQVRIDGFGVVTVRDEDHIAIAVLHASK